MGLITAYAAYRYGKKRAQRERDELDSWLGEICDHCGFERRDHIDDETQSCPVQN